MRPDDALSAGNPSFVLSFDCPVGCVAVTGNNALDHPRSRCSNARADPGGSAFGCETSVSDAISKNSTLTLLGISKLGVPLTIDRATASANWTSGCSHEPR